MEGFLGNENIRKHVVVKIVVQIYLSYIKMAPSLHKSEHKLSNFCNTKNHRQDFLKHEFKKKVDTKQKRNLKNNIIFKTGYMCMLNLVSGKLGTCYYLI